MGLPSNSSDSFEPVRVAHKKIRLRSPQPDIAKQIEKKFSLSSVASNVLAARGYKADSKLKTYINPSLRDGLPDPSGLKNLKEGAKLVAQCVKEKQGIAICCDFDVDGLSGGAQLHHFLKQVGATSKVFVPDRFEDGYGLNENMVREIARNKYTLLLTIDYGTSNFKELELARSLGLKTIVIDHHHVGSNDPGADVFINPMQTECGFADGVLSAAGLAFYFIVALRQELKAKHIEAKSYLDLACLGTICDMVPLIGTNRVIAKRGLELLTVTNRPGLKALKDVIGVRGDIGCFDVSFGIGPRLNAAGRMVHGDVVIDLLTSDDSTITSKLAKRLNALNLERQSTENQVKELAISQIKKRTNLPSGLVVWHPEFHTGVIGIVAQRLVETFYRPSVVLGMDKDGVYKGSVRGIKGFNVVEALAAVSKCLLKFGGHEGAGGLSVSVEKLRVFEETFVLECEKRLKVIDREPFSEADTEVTLDQIDLELVKELKSFAPFGMGNPAPTLLLKGLKVLEVRDLKGIHLKTMLTDGSRYISGLMWRHSSHPALITGTKVNLAFRAEASSYNGVTELQANIQAVERAEG